MFFIAGSGGWQVVPFNIGACFQIGNGSLPGSMLGMMATVNNDLHRVQFGKVKCYEDGNEHIVTYI